MRRRFAIHNAFGKEEWSLGVMGTCGQIRVLESRGEVEDQGDGDLPSEESTTTSTFPEV